MEPYTLDERVFIDEDFTDYQEYPQKKTKRETDISDKYFTSLKNDTIKAILTKIENLNPTTGSLYEIGLYPIPKGIDVVNPKGKVFLIKNKKGNFAAMLSSEDDKKSNIETIQNIASKSKNIHVLNPEAEKELQTKFIITNKALRSLLEKNVNSVRRQNEQNAKLSKKEKEERYRHEQEVKHRQEGKLKEIMDFLKDNMMSTVYVYEEVKRIQTYGEVRDKLRRLIVYLEDPENTRLKDAVLKCFFDRRKVDKPYVNVWRNRDTNNLIINDLKDPYTNGVHN